MERDIFCKKAVALALEAGCADAETFFAWDDSFEVSALDGAVDRYSVSKTAGVSVRVQLDGRDGYAYTECLDEPEQLVAHAMDNARCMDEGEAHPFQSAQRYRTVIRPASPLEALSAGQRIQLALEMERAALAADPRVRRVSHCAVEVSHGGLSMQNSRGMAAARERGVGCCYVVPVVEEKGEVQTGMAFRMGAEAADVTGCAREAVENALSRLGGKPVPSGPYRVILQNTAMADLLGAFSRMFSAEEAQKGCSLLNGREGQTVAAACVTLRDDPFHAVSPRAFDAEGTPCQTKCLIETGVLTILLHNLKTAGKAGCASTGNASRASAAAPIGVGPSVLCLQPGADSFEGLLAKLGDGLVIDDLTGLHAGVSAVSGDFSLKACGRRIVGGKDMGPVSQITVAGNFLTMLSQVLAVGNDARFTLPPGAYVSSPSVLIERLTAAGV